MAWEKVDADDRSRPLETRVLELLETHEGRLAFNGLRRALGAHPESLTRVLRRLERAGTIERTPGGYALLDPRRGSVLPLPTSHPVASARLPVGTSSDEVFGTLVGRWFGSLRWVGIYERSRDPWLVWSHDELPGHVLLRIHDGNLSVEVEDGGDPTTEEGLSRAARELFVRALQRLPPPAPPHPGMVALQSSLEWEDVTGSPELRSISDFGG